MKQAILVRSDLKLTRGKMAAQVGHACVEAALRSEKNTLKEWRDEGQKKVVLKVADEKTLLKYNQLAKDSGITTALITDAGHTHITPGTRTCVAIGPASDDKIDGIVKELQLYG